LIQNEEFIQEFIDEAKVHVEKVESSLVDFENIKTNKDTINDVFRAVHSIKGTAGFFGLKTLVSLAHSMENVFGEIRSDNIILTEDMVDILLSANDCLKDMIENIFNIENIQISKHLDSLNSILNCEVNTLNETVKPKIISIKDVNNKVFSFSGANYEILMDGIKHGHKVYEIKLYMNKDLADYHKGPIKLFKKIQDVGMLVDTITDYSDINSFDDILEAIENATIDVYLGILVTTVLDIELFSIAIDIPLQNIKLMTVEHIESNKYNELNNKIINNKNKKNNN